MKMWITTKIMWFQYIALNIWLIITWGMWNEHMTGHALFLHFLGLYVIYLYTETVNLSVKNTFLRSAFSIFIIFLYYFATKYHYRVKNSFDYAVFIENYQEMFSTESMSIILETYKPKDLYQSLSLIVMFTILQLWKGIFSAPLGFIKNRKKALRKFVVLCMILTVGPYTYEELYNVVKSGVNYYFGKTPTGKHYELLKITKENFSKKIENSPEKKRDVIIIALESFNGLYVNKKINGKEVTPTINKLIKEGLYVEDFYGNSVQTAKGHFSILCSRIPLIKDKAYYKAKIQNLDCAPKIYKMNGYNTFFHQSYGNFSFDNTQTFLNEIGFSNLETTRADLLTKSQQLENIWGWGVQDNLSYEQYVDNFKKYKQLGKPIFTLFASISHHMKFGYIPKDQQYIYENASNRQHDFVNSLHLSDLYLQTLIDRLKNEGLYENTVIVIVGDHGFPSGEHGYYDNQASFYEEFFRVPLLVISKKQIEPKIISKKSFSQIDILPTLLEISGISGEYKIQGESILKEKHGFVHLVQPYNGLYLGVVKYPYKLIWERKSNRYFLYDLENDPEETTSINNAEILEEYKQQLDKIIYNDEILRK